MSGSDDAPPPPNSVRDRLTTDRSTRLDVGAQVAGQIGAMERSGDGWTSTTVPLSITSGAIEMSAGDDGALALSVATVDFASIAIPPSVIDGNAKLTHIELRLANPPVALAATWQDDDHATVDATLDLALDWTFEANGGSFALGPQALPAVPVTLALSGDGEHVELTASLAQSGPVWSWASLIEFDDLALTLDASTQPTGAGG